MSPEALVERVARAMHDNDGGRCWSAWPDCPRADKYRRLARAAIDAITTYHDGDRERVVD